VPLTASGTVVGAVGVSGLPEHEDIELADLGRTVFESIHAAPTTADRVATDRLDGVS
jgi:uncharacterized protein (UPF0303 family)